MKIKIINPNTTQAMTDGIREAALTVARPDTEIICVSPEKGPVSIENHHDEVYASVCVVEEVRKSANDGIDTSTAVLAPIEELGKLIKSISPDTLFILDGVAATAGARCYIDKMNIDVLCTASQKAFGLPLGLAIVFAGKKSLAKRTELGTIPEYYVDYEKWIPIMDNPAKYYATPPVNMIRAMKEAIAIISAEGIEERYVRHEISGRSYKKGFRKSGIYCIGRGILSGPYSDKLFLYGWC